MKSLKEYIYEVSLTEGSFTDGSFTEGSFTEGLLDRVKNKDVNHEALIKEFLKENYFIDPYEIKTTNNKLVIDVKGNVKVINKDITSLTNGLFEFGVVSEYFDCTRCESLKTLEGAPKKVGLIFHCGHCGVQFTKNYVGKYTISGFIST